MMLICLMSWLHLFAGAGTGMNATTMTTWQFPPPAISAKTVADWDPTYWLTMVAMWWVMMIAMMLPSAAPVVLLYARVYRNAQRHGQIDTPYVPTASFLGGYLFVWLIFSLLATAGQWLLDRNGLLDAMTMWCTATVLSASFLALAGLYQFSTLKATCLKRCRSPIEFISRRWSEGRAGAAVMGIEHGLYCVGCCWLLMALLFVGGVMNLVWIAALAVLALFEKFVPGERWMSRTAGVLLLAAAVYLLAV